MTLKTLAPAMSLTTLIQIFPSLVSHQSPQMMNTTHLVTVARRVMGLVMMKRTAILTVMTAEVSNHVVKIAHLSCETLHDIEPNCTHLDDDGANTSQLPQSPSITPLPAQQEASLPHSVDDELAGTCMCIFGHMQQCNNVEV